MCRDRGSTSTGRHIRFSRQPRPCFGRTQDFAEESQEFQTGVDDNRFRRRMRTAAPAAPKRREQAADFPAVAVVELYLRCLQAGLQVTHSPKGFTTACVIWI